MVKWLTKQQQGEENEVIRNVLTEHGWQRATDWIFINVNIY